MLRQLPKAGETWRHYRGKNCLVLGVLSDGNPRQPPNPIVALELSEITTNYNERTQVTESTRVVTRFYRSLDEFMAKIQSGYRFERVEEDELMWRKGLELDAAV